MPQSDPKLSILSQPVEPQYLTVLNKVILDSFKYGLDKYAVELHTFNGRSELQDGMEELVSAGRYLTQLAMRCHKIEWLLIEAYRVMEAHGIARASGLEALMTEIKAAVDYATRELPNETA